MPLLLILILVGLAVGALTGTTGSSGVLIVVPVLGFMGLSFQESVGSSLLVDVITTSTVIFVYLRKKTVAVRSAVFMGLGALIGAQIGTRIAVSVPEEPLEIGFVILTALLAFQMFRRSKQRMAMERKPGRFSNLRPWQSLAAAMVLSIPVGILTGTIGTSGGIMFIGITMILFTISAQEMVGTATLAMLFSAMSGAAGYAYFGRIDYFASVVIGITSLASGYGFSILAHKVSEKTIYVAIGVVFVIVVIAESLKIIA
ncbi:MAG: sulfite exporter TauE/SafE family protein [Thermoplasmata archaeon]